VLFSPVTWGRLVFGLVFDIAIIGGGINGTAIARDAAGRGLSVFLCDQGDLAGGASSATTKLVHGGLHYLQGLRLRALREALMEREILMAAAPHLVRPFRVVLPHHERQWPRWALGLGLLAADRLARRTLPGSGRIDLHGDEDDGVLMPHFQVAFAYSDCLADDARLVMLNAVDARTRGASIYPRVRCVVAERDGERWRLSLESATTGERFTVIAGILVNAAGASAGTVLDHVIHTERRVPVRLTRHSHIVVRRRHDGGAYALPTADGRIVYALPYERDFMLIGAVSGRFEGDPAAARVEPRDVAYLLDVAGQYFEEPPDAADVVSSFAGVCALPEEHSPAVGDSAVIVDAPAHLAPLISVFGGTLTTHRRIAERVVNQIGRFRMIGAPWTATATLPGGNLPADGVGGLGRALRGAYPFISESHAARLAAAYGTRAQTILSGRRQAADLGTWFGGDLTQAEVDFLKAEEWAMTAEDVLWRRSKLGLTLSKGEVAALDRWLAADPGVRPATVVA
jgi:glycerol-3-phosphate dehydrogenase